jgi:hypothetical protein
VATVDQGHLPHVAIRMVNGLLTEIRLDGARVRGVKAVSFTADVSGGYPRVTLELWATVEMSGEMATTITQERHVARCARPHRDEGAPGPIAHENGHQEPTSDDCQAALVRGGATR